MIQIHESDSCLIAFALVPYSLLVNATTLSVDSLTGCFTIVETKRLGTNPGF